MSVLNIIYNIIQFVRKKVMIYKYKMNYLMSSFDKTKSLISYKYIVCFASYLYFWWNTNVVVN